ncbi:MAG: hypothetical protein KJO54_07605 [Gammaproteobacteria bacterium]|nr:hypothetical protein [Gammaproteobacteria bacterium]NNF61606.1 hypothetical protein [Gammaproteobacteria bacterium]
MVRVRAAAGTLKLLSAREGGPEMDRITALGLDVDEGMVLIAGDELYYGSDAIHALSLLSSRSGLFNRLNFLVFRSKALSRVIYPVLRAGRNLALKLLRRSRINNLELPENDRF